MGRGASSPNAASKSVTPFDIFDMTTRQHEQDVLGAMDPVQARIVGPRGQGKERAKFEGLMARTAPRTNSGLADLWIARTQDELELMLLCSTSMLKSYQDNRGGPAALGETATWYRRVMGRAKKGYQADFIQELGRQCGGGKTEIFAAIGAIGRQT